MRKLQDLTDSERADLAKLADQAIAERLLQFKLNTNAEKPSESEMFLICNMGLVSAALALIFDDTELKDFTEVTDALYQCLLLDADD
jgi:hypothetical protein